ncbi:MAG TPA: hypothetical protein VH593_20590 [Ktedonobacteraceae bacterium]
MNALRTVVKMYTRGNLTWFFLPWMIVCIQFPVALIVTSIVEFFGGGKPPSYPGGLITICLSMFVWGIMSLTDTFPFALGFGVRRTDYVLGTMVIAVEVSTVAVVLWLLCSLLEIVTGGWGVELHYFYLPYFNDGSLIEQFWVYFVVLASMYILGFVVGSVYQRFGRVGAVTFGLTVLLLISLFALVWTYLRWWGAFLTWFSQFSAFELTLGVLLLTAFYLLVAYLLLRRAVA